MLSGCPRCAGLRSRHRASRPRPWLSAGDTTPNEGSLGVGPQGSPEQRKRTAMGPADGTGGPAPHRLPAPDTARSRPSAASGRTAPPRRRLASHFRQRIRAWSFRGRGEWARGGPSATSRGRGVDPGGTGSGIPAWQRAPRLGAPRGARYPGPQCPGRRGVRASERPRRGPGGHHAAPALPLERPRPAVGWESGMGSEHVDKQGNVR